MVINTSAGQIPNQISEIQDTLIIFNWIAQWIKCGIQTPNEDVFDYLFLLLNEMAMARTMTLSHCFEVTRGNHQNLTSCYIRINVAKNQQNILP